MRTWNWELAGHQLYAQRHGNWRVCPLLYDMLESRTGLNRWLGEVGDQNTDVLSELPGVAILMTTYEGQRFLAEQVESILAQTCQSWRLWVSDDSSGQATAEVLERFSGRMRGRYVYQQGPRKGAVANFLELACNAGIRARFYAFSDQDDVWDADKLERALAWLEGMPSAVPALYCTRTRLIDEQGCEVGLSPLFSRTPAFGNALVQSLAGGNTMVFNEAARQLLIAAGKDVDVPVHDWWLYLLVTGCGGVVHYDALPSLAYRQHGGNLIGGNAGWLSRFRRIPVVMKDVHRQWFGRNIGALARVRNLLTDDNRRKFDFFVDARARWLFPRILNLRKAGTYRQTWYGSLSLFVLIVLGKI